MTPRHLFRSRALRLACIATGFSLLGALPEARADITDVSLLFVTKTQLYLQNSQNNPVLRPIPFAFEAGATPARSNSIVSGLFTAPGGATRSLNNLGGGNFFYDGGAFATQAALNAAFFNGTYNFALQTTTAPQAFNDSVAILNDQYPTNVPKILNGTWSSGALEVDPTKEYFFQWNDVSPFVSPNRMVLEILDASNKIVFTQVFPPDPSGFNINFQLPANTLQPGGFYTGKLTFERRQVVAGSGGTLSKVGTYAIETAFKIVTIGGSPVVDGPTTPLGTVGQLFIYQIIASNHPYTYAVTALPPGLTLNSTLGLITGIPTTAGTTPATISATNTIGTGTKTNFAPTIQPAPSGGPTIVSTTAASGYAGQPFKFQVATKGATAAARVTATGLPAGLTLDPVTGEISGTTNGLGSFNVNLSVQDGNFTASGFLQLIFTADPGFPIITNANTVLVPKNLPFNYQIATPGATDPIDPVIYNLVGTLPAGLVFNAVTGVISGTFTGSAPTQADNGGISPHAPELSGGALLGTVQLFGTNAHGTSTFQLLFLAQPTGAVNISTRLFVGTNENVMIGGFIVTGNVPKVVIIRALGPSLGIPGALQDPVLELHDSANHVVINDNWKSSQEQIIRDTTIPPADDREAAIVIALDPGNYTAIVSGKNSTTGIGLVELYDLGSATLDTTSKAQLAQISTRGNVLQNDNVMIGGFIISGGATNVIVRAIGPSLRNFGITNACDDTTVELYNGSGTSLGLNDDWRSTQETEIIATTVPPADNRESAIVKGLVPGPYTAIVRGKNNTTGVALVEVYGLP